MIINWTNAHTQKGWGSNNNQNNENSRQKSYAGSKQSFYIEKHLIYDE